MLTLVKSTDANLLLAHFAQVLRDPKGGVFTDHRLIIPSMTINDWLVNKIADRLGICAQLQPMFRGEFAWRLAEEVTGDFEGGRTPLSVTSMSWQLFADFCMRAASSDGQSHLHDANDATAQLLNDIPSAEGSDPLKKYQFIAKELAEIFVRYLSMRPNWLWRWSTEKNVPLEDLLSDLQKFSTLPKWIKTHSSIIAAAQQQLWQTHFAEPFLRRCLRMEMFWRILQRERGAPEDASRTYFTQRISDAELAHIFTLYPSLENHWQQLHENSKNRRANLPDHIFVYGIEGFFQDQWHFIADLGQFSQITVYHQLITPLYFADMTDEKFLSRLQLEGKGMARESIHPLLSRFGKQQQSTFLLLEKTEEIITAKELPFIRIVDLEGDNEAEKTLLKQLQTELHQLSPHLIAAHSAKTSKAEQRQDQSIMIHGCHSLMRQLEILRGELAHALNHDPELDLSDILIVLPDIVEHQGVIRAIFPPSGHYDGYSLPARLTGIPSPAAQNLWNALAGHYYLIDGYFDSESVCSWLLSDDICAMLDVSHEAMERISKQLLEAGFRRGFDENSFPVPDGDNRFTFCYALDRLCAGLLQPHQPHYVENIIPQKNIHLDDRHAINALCRLANRWQQYQKDERRPVRAWIAMLRDQLEEDFAFAAGSSAHATISKGLLELDSQLLALERESRTIPDVPLLFVLDDISAHLAEQQTSSEPSGVITIGRLSAMRGIPYKIIAFLNCNAGDFPSGRIDKRYDLMALDKEQAGDRRREHEDLGAFLQLLCHAEKQLLLFYNRSSLEGEEQLPAAPLQELLQYLREQGIDENAIHHHQQPDPFHPDQSSARPAPLWRNLAEKLRQPQTRDDPARHYQPPAELPPLPKQEKYLALRFNDWITGLQKPAQHYATAQDIGSLARQTVPESFEPLVFNAHQDGLKKYQILDYLLQHPPRADAFDPLPHLPLLPVGAGKDVYLSMVKAQLKSQKATLAAELDAPDAVPIPTPVTEQIIKIADIHLSAPLPISANGDWLLHVASKQNKLKHVLKQWLLHVARHAAGGKGKSICAYQDKTVIFQAFPSPEAAQNELEKWLRLWFHAQRELWILPLGIFDGDLRQSLGNICASTVTTSAREDKLRQYIYKWLKNIDQDVEDNALWRLFLPVENTRFGRIFAFANQYAVPLLQNMYDFQKE